MPTLIELLEAGVHFGHKKERSHPKMKNYIFSIREGVYIIDLDKTRELLKEALDFLKKQAEEGKTILFVGTKRQAKDLVEKTAINSGMPYVTHRWLGGTLTNFETVSKSIKELESLEAKIKSPEYEALTKKEKKVINDRIEKLQMVFGGIREMKNLPDVVLVIDAHREKLAVDEASKMGIKVVALADTDANPEKIDYLIPSNDDAAKAVELVMNEVSSVLGVKKGKKVEDIGDKEEKQKEESDINKTKEVEKSKPAKADRTASKESKNGEKK